MVGNFDKRLETLEREAGLAQGDVSAQFPHTRDLIRRLFGDEVADRPEPLLTPEERRAERERMRNLFKRMYGRDAQF